MYTEKMLKIGNIHRENTMNRQCMQGVYWESSMQGERMLGIHNVRRKMLGIHKRTENMVGITNTRKQTSRNRQYKVREW